MRFYRNPDDTTGKIDTAADFPERLDMSQHVSDDLIPRECQYVFMSVVKNTGSMEDGHYTSYVRQGGLWWCCNDGSVSPITLEKALNEQAYILFYERAEF
jgi:ubiquitin C-terminal hydrolase